MLQSHAVGSNSALFSLASEFVPGFNFVGMAGE
jgi:hypothetical protein